MPFFTWTESSCKEEGAKHTAYAGAKRTLPRHLDGQHQVGTWLQSFAAHSHCEVRCIWHTPDKVPLQEALSVMPDMCSQVHPYISNQAIELCFAA